MPSSNSKLPISPKLVKASRPKSRHNRSEGKAFAYFCAGSVLAGISVVLSRSYLMASTEDEDRASGLTLISVAIFLMFIAVICFGGMAWNSPPQFVSFLGWGSPWGYYGMTPWMPQPLIMW